MTKFSKTIGVDISKLHLDIYTLPNNKHKRFTNNDKGINSLLKCINQDFCQGQKFLMLVEPTGDYGWLLQQRILLNDDHITFSQVDAAKIRNFAKSMGYLVKTDKLDAQIIAEYGIRMDTKPMIKRSQRSEELAELVKRRRQLVDDLAREKNRLEKARIRADKNTLASIKEHSDFLTARINKIDIEINEAILCDAELKEVHDLLINIQGVGKVTASVLIAELPELGKIGNAEISSLVGVAPGNRDSGQMQGERHIYGGRMSVRCALYMSVITAMRHNDKIKEFYHRLRSNGKKPKVALVACMRKLIIIMNATIRNYYLEKNA